MSPYWVHYILLIVSMSTNMCTIGCAEIRGQSVEMVLSFHHDGSGTIWSGHQARQQVPLLPEFSPQPVLQNLTRSQKLPSKFYRDSVCLPKDTANEDINGNNYVHIGSECMWP